MSKSVVITSATRTAVGSLGKALKNIPSEELGSVVIKEAIKRSNIKSSDVDETITVSYTHLTLPTTGVV